MTHKESISSGAAVLAFFVPKLSSQRYLVFANLVTLGAESWEKNPPELLRPELVLSLCASKITQPA